MDLKNYEFQSGFARKHAAIGKAKGLLQGDAKGRSEGEVRGRVEGQAFAIVRVLETRGFAMSQVVRQRILDCSDRAMLASWIERAAVASSVAEVVRGDLLDDAAFLPMLTPRIGRNMKLVFLDLIISSLSEAALRELEVLQGKKEMARHARRFTALGKLQGRLEGELEGRIAGKAKGHSVGQALAILRFLKVLRVAVPRAARGTILACTDQATLDSWIQRVAAAATSGQPAGLSDAVSSYAHA